MSNYKVTEKDLIGDIKGFPIEVVEKMLEKQRMQRGYVNITTLQTDVCGAFRWCDTSEDYNFWHKVIREKDFIVFFKKYPKSSKYVYIYQDGTKNGKDIIDTLIKHGGKNNNNWQGKSEAFYYISPKDNKIELTSTSSDEGILVKHFYTEIQPESSVKEYTMQEIADKLGIKVDELRIKK